MADFLTPPEFGRRLIPTRCESTVLRWIKQKKIKAHNISLGRPTYRIPASELERVQAFFDARTEENYDPTDAA